MAKEKKEKKNLNLANKEKVDSVLAYILIKKLLKPIVKTDAFKFKLVNKNGRIIKEPETDEEKSALTLFDRVIFQIIRLLGGKKARLNAFIYLHSLDDDFYDHMVVTGGLDKRGAIKRMERDIENVIESHDIPLETFFKRMIAEGYRNRDEI